MVWAAEEVPDLLDYAGAHHGRRTQEASPSIGKAPRSDLGIYEVAGKFRTRRGGGKAAGGYGAGKRLTAEADVCIHDEELLVADTSGEDMAGTCPATFVDELKRKVVGELVGVDEMIAVSQELKLFEAEVAEAVVDGDEDEKGCRWDKVIGHGACF
jgi:hypothetical protein